MSNAEHDRGNALLQQGKAQSAAELFRRLVRQSANDALAHAGLGNALIQLGRDQEAWDSLARACQLSDRISHAFGGLALLALKHGDRTLAGRMAERAIALNPADANSLFVLAQVLFGESRFDEAERAFARATSLNARYLDARNTLGNAAFDRGDHGAAARHYASFAQLRPKDAKAWLNWGLSLARAGQLDAARDVLEKAVALAPDQIKPLALFVSVLRESRAGNAQLIEPLTRLAELTPDAADVRLHLARALIGEKRYHEAKIHLRRVLAIDPSSLVARWLDFQRPDDEVAPDEAARTTFLAHWREGIGYFEGVDWRNPHCAAQADETLASSTNFHLAYLGLPLLEELRRNAAVLRKLTLTASPNFAEAPIRAIGRKRRKVAVFSPSLTNHSVERVWSASLLRLDATEFELAVFSPEARDAAGAARWRERGVRFEAGERLAQEWIAALREFAPDIMVFLDIGMHPFVQALASLRHAPVQVTTWGHPVSSGMPTIDYFLSADAFEPEDAAAHYSETLVRLPRLGVYLETPAVPAPAMRSSDGQLRLLCAQSVDKLHPAHDALFARVLAACGDARLDVLCAAAPASAAELAARMRNEFARHHLDFDARCRVHPRLDLVQYQRLLGAADVCLDSLDFSGCLTTVDALWNDKPIVTLPGALMRGRQTSGMLRLVDVPELIARSQDDYVRIAAGLANDAAQRAAITRRVAEGKHLLFEDHDAAAAFAEFLRTVEPRIDLTAARAD